MPTIKKNKAQQRALDEVTKKLDTLATIAALEGDANIVNTSIVFTKEGDVRKKALKVELTNDDAKEMKKLLSIIDDLKKKLSKEIRDKAKKFGLSLSKQELLLLAGEPGEPDSLKDDDDDVEDDELM